MRNSLNHLSFLFLLSITICFGQNNENTTTELRVRSGLPNFFAKIESGKKVKVAYLGGSITHQEGWRPKTFNWLQKQYPKASFEMINAAVPGTGADFANCRLKNDLLDKNPDLVFVEFRVNGSSGFGVRAHEGLVRQIRSNNPKTDICFVYTVGKNMISNLRKGLQHGEGKKMEKTAIYYNIPSIDFGIEVVKQLDIGNYVFNKNSAKHGQKVFCRDNVHPTQDGYEIYKKVIARSFIELEGKGKVGKHKLPNPLENNYFSNTHFVSVSKAKKSSGWKKVKTNKDKVYLDDEFRTSKMLSDAVKCDRIGETLSVQWKGTNIGFSTIPIGEGFEVEIQIDGGKPKKYSFSQKAPKNKNRIAPKFSRSFYAPEQESGNHTATLKVTKLAKGTSFYCGQFWVVGKKKY
jgi:hypothetical protein